MKKLSFSVSIPVYGVGKYIEKFARSLFAQTYSNVQYVFVNDGTKDASIDILRSLIDREFSHLKDRILIIDKENGGVSTARKAGVAACTGDYIMHADPDDWFEPDAIEKIASVAEQTDADIIYYDFYKEYENRTGIGRERDFDISEKKTFIRNLYNCKGFGYLWNKCAKRSLYEEHEIFFSPYGMHDDIYVVAQLLCYARSYVHLKEPLYHYRKDNPTSIIAGKKEKGKWESSVNMLDLYEHFKDHLEGSPVEPMLGDIVYSAGWNTLHYGFDFFERYPYLADLIRQFPVSFKYHLLVPRQIYVRCKLPR